MHVCVHANGPCRGSYVCSAVYRDPLSSFAGRNTYTAILAGSMAGGTAIICCIVWTVTCLFKRRHACQRRSFPTVAATQVPPTSAVINERVTPVQGLHHVTPTNPDGPPSYVASTNLESSKPPPYTADLINSPMATAVEDTPTSLEDTSQPFPPEFIPIEDDLPPEYLPPPGGDPEMLPLHGVPPTNPDASSDPPTSTADLNICSPHTTLQDTPTPQSLPPESSVSSNDENQLSEHHPLADNDYEVPPVQAAPPMDVNAPPPCVPSVHLQSSNSAPCTSNTSSCSIPISVEDTPIPQPLLPESPHSMPNDEDVQLEYFPTHGSSA